MREFDLGDFADLVVKLEHQATVLAKLANQGQGGIHDPVYYQYALGIINDVRTYASKHLFTHCLDVTTPALSHLRDYKKTADISTLSTALSQVRDALLTEAYKRKFLHVSPEYSDHVDQTALFGPEVYSAFPSAHDDIREAGNCLAVECCTAAVFHLMRAAEFGLRALAHDRRIEFSGQSLEQKQWGEILAKLDSIVRALREAPRTNWPDSAIRDQQIRFYSEVTQEFRRFNDAWRRHVSHADTVAFYDRNYAASVMNHVRLFMQKLALKITEEDATDEYWQQS